jgi:hypothetical protein
MIKKGIVAKQGVVIGKGGYVGEDMILTDYFRPYVVRTLSFVDCFRLSRSDLMALFHYGQFPRVRVGYDRTVVPVTGVARVAH